MLFSTHIFLLLFMPLTLALYYYCAVRHGVRMRLWLLVIASLVFYGYWDVRFVPFLLGSVGINWILAHYFGVRGKRWILGMGVAINLALIGFFKYFNFFMGNLVPEFSRWDIILPLGISFFTFQQISYLLDLKHGKAPRYDFLHYTLYVTFFPQLIAGPIVRHDELIPQLNTTPLRKGMHERLSRGAALFVLGLAKKVLVADQLVGVVDSVFAATPGAEGFGFAASWMAALAYTVELYYDFSSYSDMAVGLGLMFGFTLPINFDAPYRSRSIREFWRRWHMTLSRFLRDYLYIPMGGNRQVFSKQAGAIVITMFLCGLWHGAGWTFVVWGAAHGVALVINNGWRRLKLPMPLWLGWLLTFVFVTYGWVLFRAGDFALALHVMQSMSGLNGLSFVLDSEVKRLWLVPVGLALAILGPTSTDIALKHLKPSPYIATCFALVFIYIVLEVGKGQGNDFIYFQF